jgi:hypothetical protein
MEHTHAFTAGTKQTFILAIRLRSSSLNSALDMEADFGKRQKAVVLPRMWLFKAQVTGSSWAAAAAAEPHAFHAFQKSAQREFF